MFRPLQAAHLKDVMSSCVEEVKSGKWDFNGEMTQSRARRILLLRPVCTWTPDARPEPTRIRFY